MQMSPKAFLASTFSPLQVMLLFTDYFHTFAQSMKLRRAWTLFTWFCSLMKLKPQGECLTHSRGSVDICQIHIFSYILEQNLLTREILFNHMLLIVNTHKVWNLESGRHLYLLIRIKTLIIKWKTLVHVTGNSIIQQVVWDKDPCRNHTRGITICIS